MRTARGRGLVHFGPTQGCTGPPWPAQGRRLVPCGALGCFWGPHRAAVWCSVVLFGVSRCWSLLPRILCAVCDHFLVSFVLPGVASAYPFCCRWQVLGAFRDFNMQGGCQDLLHRATVWCTVVLSGGSWCSLWCRSSLPRALCAVGGNFWVPFVSAKCK